MPVFSLLTLCSVLFFAAVWDLRFCVIPNRLFLTGMVLAVLCRILKAEPPESGETVLSICILCILFFFYAVHGIGGGDVKMAVFIQFLYPGCKGILILWLCLLYSAAAGIIACFRFGTHRVRLGAGMFLGALTAAFGGYL